MKHYSICVFLMIVIYMFHLEMTRTVSRKSQIYDLILSQSEIMYILPKNGASTFQPIRINYVHVTNEIIPNYKSGLNGEEFKIFKKLIIDPVDNFFRKSLKLYPNNKFPISYRYQILNQLNLLIDVDIGKYLQGYVRLKKKIILQSFKD